MYVCVFCYLSMHFDILMSFHVFADFAQKVCATFCLLIFRFAFEYNSLFFGLLAPVLRLFLPFRTPHAMHTNNNKPAQAASEAALLIRLECWARQSLPGMCACVEVQLMWIRCQLRRIQWRGIISKGNKHIGCREILNQIQIQPIFYQLMDIVFNIFSRITYKFCFFIANIL